MLSVCQSTYQYISLTAHKKINSVSLSVCLCISKFFSQQSSQFVSQFNKSVVSTSLAVVCQSEIHSVTSVSMSVIQAIQQVAALINQIYQPVK